MDIEDSVESSYSHGNSGSLKVIKSYYNIAQVFKKQNGVNHGSRELEEVLKRSLKSRTSLN
jgi:hypothetical protein